MLRIIVLIALSFAIVCLAETLSLRKRATVTRALDRAHENDYHLRPPISGGAGDSAGGGEKLQLMDIVLAASVDGKFHAFNRSSGHTLWSMSSFPGSAPSSLGPLVRTHHTETDNEVTDDDDAEQELYVIEPQSGDIYVMATPTSPLQRLAFSMSQLVDMSPFSFSADEDRRVFYGKKETSLVSIELETGKVKEINGECPWDPFEDLHEEARNQLDLDDLEGTDPPKPTLPSTEISIGRTDYHIAIHTSPKSKSSPKPPVQHLSFSTYGPNNRDNTVQAKYRRSVDDSYVQSFPNGDIFAFKAANRGAPIDPLWGNKISAPVVAVFDIVRSQDREEPFALLQPRPRLEDGQEFPNSNAAYVGLVPESMSLFAMTPAKYPLVAFGDSNNHEYDVRGLPAEVDAITERRKMRELCRNGATDRRCLTGKRPLEESRDSWRRMLDAVPIPSAGHVIHSPIAFEPERTLQPVSLPEIENSTTTTLLRMWTTSGRPLLGFTEPSQAPAALATLFLSVIIGAFWLYKKLGSVRITFNNDFKTKVSPAINISTMQVIEAVTEPASLETTLIDSSVVLPASAPASATSDSFVIVNASDTVKAVNDPVIATDAALLPPADVEDSERETGDMASPRKSGRKKRRGKKKRAGALTGAADDEEAEEEKAEDEIKVVAETPTTNLVFPSTPKLEAPSTSLIVSDTILGFGSHGTVVFSGSLQGRAVAVKRLLQDFVTLASREVSILQESDDHPNVIRYYYQEAQANFLYIALELCPASLADIIESPDRFRDISVTFNPKRALRQITSGLRHLHSLKLVHRDIKPQNILVSSAKKTAGRDPGHRMLISDFGLCKKLELDQTSFLPTAHGAMAAGTVGWRAPEILRGEVKLDDSTGDDSLSSRGSVATISGSTSGTTTGKPTRLTKLVDIFALGCLFYYVLSNGGHPYGDRFEREVNILKDVKSLDQLERFGEEGAEAVQLISSMLSVEAHDRPDTVTCLLHPFFWDQGRRLTFLQDASDRFEIMCRDPRDQHLITLEKGAFEIVGSDWHSRLDKIFIENLGKFRKYDGKSVQDLLRALRNKKHHYQDLPDNVKRHLGPMPEGFLSYFTRRYPRLFLHVHSVVASTSLRQESMFRSYFELAE